MVFSIHTYLMALGDLPPGAAEGWRPSPGKGRGLNGPGPGRGLAQETDRGLDGPDPAAA